MDHASKIALQKILKDHGHSITAPRLMMCELLWNQEPLSIHELITRSRGKLDRASLYRTLTLFEQLGLLQRVYIGWKYKVELSDALTHHHHHMSCTKCGAIATLADEDEIEQLIATLAARHGFTATSHQLEIQGICAVCVAV